MESAAKGGGVYPEVLFDVARKWFELFEEMRGGATHDAHSPVIENAPVDLSIVSLDQVAVGESQPMMSQPVNVQSISHAQLQCQNVANITGKIKLVFNFYFLSVID